MNVRPPSRAKALLERSLGDRDAAQAILGDLEEDFHAYVISRGVAYANRRYWKEAVALAGRSSVDRFTDDLHNSTDSLRYSASVDQTGAYPMNHPKSFLATLFSGGWRDDTRFALRRIGRDKRFFAFAAVIIGIAVGATTAVYSVMGPLVLRPLQLQEPDQLVWVANGASGGMSTITSRTSNLTDFRELNNTLVALGGYNAFFEYNTNSMTGDGDPERVIVVDVTQDFLRILGVAPVLGRDFVEEEGVPGNSSVAILANGFWQRRFGADPGIIGKTMVINDAAVEIVGVLPQSFDFSSTFRPGSNVDYLTPFPITDQSDNWGNTLSMVGRMGPGVTLEATQADFAQIVTRLKQAQPDRWGMEASVSGLQEQVSGSVRSSLFLLAAAAASVLLIACANLSNLLLARGPSRRKEMAVRSALGATRHRMLRQLMIESVVLSLAGALIGVAIAVGVTNAVASSTAFEIPLLNTVAVDGSALLFTLLIATVSGLLVGILPALQASQGGEAGIIREEGRGSIESKRSRRVRELLVVAEVAMACVLLVGGGLLIRSFNSVLNVDMGYEPAEAISWRVDTSRQFEDQDQAAAYYDELMARVSALPGVSAVGITDTPPLGRNRSWGILLPGQSNDGGDSHSAFPRVINETYLSTMEIPLLSGRSFSVDEPRDGQRVLIINETAARVLFEGQDPINRMVFVSGEEWQVIGVVGDVRHQALEEGSGLEIYLSVRQWWLNSMEMVVRSTLPPEALVPSVRRALSEADPMLPTDEYATLQSVVDDAVSPRRFTMLLLGAFAATSLLLAAVGIYGVLSYSVSQRIPEIGIRMALGETTTQVQRRVVGRTMALAVTGVALGALAAAASTRMFSSLLYGVAPTDAVTFFGVAAVLLLVSGIAGYLPARRASKADPASAFRAT